MPQMHLEEENKKQNHVESVNYIVNTSMTKKNECELWSILAALYDVAGDRRNKVDYSCLTLTCQPDGVQS